MAFSDIYRRLTNLGSGTANQTKNTFGALSNFGNSFSQAAKDTFKSGGILGLGGKNQSLTSSPSGSASQVAQIYGPTQPKAPTPAQVAVSSTPPTNYPGTNQPIVAPTTPVNYPGTNQPIVAPPVQNTGSTVTASGGSTAGITAGDITPTQSGFTSTDPDVLAKIAAMQSQTSPQAPVVAPTAPISLDGGSAGATGTNDLQTQLNALQQQYLTSLAPGADELAKQQELASFQESARLGIMGLEGQGRGIPLALVQGQQEKLGGQASIQEQTLLQQLGNIEAARTGQGLVAQTGLGFTQQALTAQNQAQQGDKANLLSLITAGFQPITDASQAGGQQTFSMGGQLFTAPQDKPETTNNILEYQYALDNGLIPEGTGFIKFMQDQNGSTSGTGTEGALTENQKLSQAQDLVKNGSFKDINSAMAAINSGDYSGATSGGGEVSAIKTQALTSARDLLGKLLSGDGTSAVGMSRIFGLQNIPGTAPKDFEIQFNNLKSLLSLDNVALLKGQGAVSDSEREMLNKASAKLELSQSEDEFKSALQDIVNVLGGVDVSNLTPTAIPSKEKLLESFTGREMKDGSLVTASEAQQLYEYASNMAALGYTTDYITQALNESLGFKSDLNTSVNGSNFSSYASSLGNGKVTQDYDTPSIGTLAKSRATHGGLDIGGAGHEGDPVPVFTGGTVVSSGNEGGWGNTITVKDAQGNIWRYAHMGQLNVKAGDTIPSGYQVGTIGSTGESSGPHVHIEVKNSQGQLIDPKTLNIA